MNTVAGEGIEEDGQGSDERLTFTRCHFGDFTLMEHRTTKELHVVVNHFPLQVVASGSPMVVIDGFVAVDADEVFLRVGSQLAVEVGGGNDGFLVFGKASGCVLDDAERHGHHFVQGFLVFVERLFLQFVDVVEYRFALVDGRFLDRSLELGYLLLLLSSRFLHKMLYFLGFGTQRIIVQSLNFGVCRLHFLHERLNQFHVSCRFVAEE